jgi:predicted ATPase
MTKIQQTLAMLLQQKKLEPYITHLRFPRYKNLADDLRVDFLHPITALVGQNGTNKSSILRALYGSPGYNNLGQLWFSTSVDPIEEGDNTPNCFIYGYYNTEAEKNTEVLKSRVRRDNEPDNWEPSRPIARYGMQPFQRGLKDAPAGGSRTRWKNIRKAVVYIDFRAQLSAFDKFFYYGQVRSKGDDLKTKKEYIRSRASRLKSAIENKTRSFEWYGERIINSENTLFSEQDVLHVSKILGREYKEIALIRHSFYSQDGYTARMKSADLQYTEAFAGSGEFSVVALVYAIQNANDASLILLDEPEVSLHPGAQERLMNYIAEMVKTKKHQVVLSTHSPAIVRNLPPDAIKLLMLDSVSGRVILPKQASLAEEAFFHLGEPLAGKLMVIVEDRLAMAIVQKVLQSEGEAFSHLFKVVYYPGGASSMWAYHATGYAAEGRENVLFLLDGDQFKSEIPQSKDIPQSQDLKLSDVIKSFTGCSISFPVDGGSDGGNKMQLIAAQRAFIDWASKFVRFLPDTNPEAFVWNNMQRQRSTGEKPKHNAKTNFVEYTRKVLALKDFVEIDSDEIFTVQRIALGTIADSNEGLQKIRRILHDFAKKT